MGLRSSKPEANHVVPIPAAPYCAMPSRFAHHRAASSEHCPTPAAVDEDTADMIAVAYIDVDSPSPKHADAQASFGPPHRFAPPNFLSQLPTSSRRQRSSSTVPSYTASNRLIESLHFARAVLDDPTVGASRRTTLQRCRNTVSVSILPQDPTRLHRQFYTIRACPDVQFPPSHAIQRQRCAAVRIKLSSEGRSIPFGRSATAGSTDVEETDGGPRCTKRSRPSWSQDVSVSPVYRVVVPCTQQHNGRSATVVNAWLHETAGLVATRAHGRRILLHETRSFGSYQTQQDEFLFAPPASHRG